MLSLVDTPLTREAGVIVGAASKDSGVPALARRAVQKGVPFVETWTMGKLFTPMNAGPEFVQYNIPEPIRTSKLTVEILFEGMGDKGNFVNATTGDHERCSQTDTIGGITLQSDALCCCSRSLGGSKFGVTATPKGSSIHLTKRTIRGSAT